MRVTVKAGKCRGIGKDMSVYLESLESEIWLRIVDHGETLAEVSRFLQELFPNQRGLSVRSLRRFCRARDIHYRSNINSEDLDRIVHFEVTRVGHSYGRRTLHGLLRSRGIHVSQSRVGASLRRVFPLAHSVRRQTLGRLLNPIPYRANYYGQKIHWDQNEKLVMYGIVHVAAVDGFSRKIVAFSTMPRKNAITIYNTMYRPLTLSEGIWDQLRSDHGTEFCLIATVQEHLSNFRVNQQRLPVLQTTSRQNHRVERLWPEVNSRINYPVKAVLVSMEETEMIDMRNNTHKYAVSWVGIRVTAPAITTFINAWNSHCIPGHQGRRGGIPNTLANTSQIGSIPAHQVPSTSEAIQMHESIRGPLTQESTYGIDPLSGNERLQLLRERDFHNHYPSAEAIFSDVLHNRGALLKEAILTFIELSDRFTQLLP